MEFKGIDPQYRPSVPADPPARTEGGAAAGFVRILDREVKAADTPPVKLGTISRANPTVSDLLIQHPRYGKDCWKIIHGAQNRSKPFTRIRPGTDIYLNPQTMEILWGRQVQAPPDAAPEKLSAEESSPPPAKETEPLAERLVSAVKPYLGRPYEEVNCYELLVHGLKELGVRYAGKGGLAYHLISRARGEGLPLNAFLNGEGVVDTSGTKVYAKSILHVKNAEKEAGEVIAELKPLLRKGDILSFSLHSRGHTGIVSRRGEDWTFINSGRMDHAVEERLKTASAKQVGEEYLDHEIRDWLRLAAESDESLVITLGRLKEHKLAEFRREGAAVYRKA